MRVKRDVQCSSENHVHIYIYIYIYIHTYMATYMCIYIYMGHVNTSYIALGSLDTLFSEHLKLLAKGPHGPSPQPRLPLPLRL